MRVRVRASAGMQYQLPLQNGLYEKQQFIRSTNGSDIGRAGGAVSVAGTHGPACYNIKDRKRPPLPRKTSVSNQQRNCWWRQ